jgi:hypothetical protein
MPKQLQGRFFRSAQMDVFVRQLCVQKGSFQVHSSQEIFLWATYFNRCICS